MARAAFSGTTRSLPYAGLTDWLASWFTGSSSYAPGQQAAVDADLVRQNQQILAAIQGYQLAPTPAPVNPWTLVAMGVGAIGAGLLVVDLARRAKNRRV